MRNLLQKLILILLNIYYSKTMVHVPSEEEHDGKVHTIWILVYIDKKKDTNLGWFIGSELGLIRKINETGIGHKLIQYISMEEFIKEVEKETES